MNKQGKISKINGLNKIAGGIEWTKRVLPDGNERGGYTWNPVAGCLHRCRWRMPNGTIAVCYAESTAHGVARASYPEGFEHHYWHPERLEEPLRVTQPARIFLDSMSDLMGRWVADEQIEAVLDVARRAHWHDFQLLTKNAPRLLKFDFPANVWVGVSSPPDWMNGQVLTPNNQTAFLTRALKTLEKIDVPVKWMSFEPLSWAVADIVAQYPEAIRWAVIGAATNGRVAFQPDPAHVQRLLDVLDRQGVSTFFKGSLEWATWREEFPA